MLGSPWGGDGYVVGSAASRAPDRRHFLRRACVGKMGGRDAGRQVRRGGDVPRLRAPHLLPRHHRRHGLGVCTGGGAHAARGGGHHRVAARPYPCPVEHAGVAAQSRHVDVQVAGRRASASQRLCGRCRRGADALCVRISRLRCAPLQPAAHGAPQGLSRQRFRRRVTCRLRAVRAGRVEDAPHGRGGRARSPQ